MTCLLAPKSPSDLELDLSGGGAGNQGLLARPSNLKRASALPNLYEDQRNCWQMGKAGLTRVPYDALLGPETPLLQSPSGSFASSDMDTLALLLARSPLSPHRPRLPSAESLSRCPCLPCLCLGGPQPFPGSFSCSGRKGSIQDRAPALHPHRACLATGPQGGGGSGGQGGGGPPGRTPTSTRASQWLRSTTTST